MFISVMLYLHCGLYAFLLNEEGRDDITLC